MTPERKRELREAADRLIEEGDRESARMILDLVAYADLYGPEQ